MTIGMIGNPELDYLSWAINWGLAYDLPNETWIVQHRNEKILPKPFVQRRHRRDLYNRLEIAIEKFVCYKQLLVAHNQLLNYIEFISFQYGIQWT